MKIKFKILKALIPDFQNLKWTMAIKHFEETEYTIIYSPRNEFWADPFIVEKDDKVYIYFEAYEYKNRKGYIACGEYNRNEKRLINIKTILKDDFHHSFPAVFEHNSKYYLVPETYQKNKVLLYEITKFPDKIRLIRTLLDNINSADTVLTKHNSHWFLFTSPNRDDEHLGHQNNIEVFYSDNLVIDPFKKVNIMNLEKSGFENSRMAGNIVLENGKMFRYSQDCVKRYGNHINKNEILLLNKKEYSEKFIKTLDKPKYAVAMHTYNKSQNYEVVDFSIKQKGLLNFIYYNYMWYKQIPNIILKKLKLKS